MSISIAVNPKWPVYKVIEFFEGLQKSLLTSHEILSITDIYEMKMAKTMIDQIDFFFPMSRHLILLFSKTYGFALYPSASHETVIKHYKQYRTEFSEDINDIISVYKTFPDGNIGECLSCIRKKEYKDKLQKSISAIEKKVADHEEKIRVEEENEIIRVQKAKDMREAVEKRRRDEIERKRQEENTYVTENRAYYNRCKYYIDNGYDGYTEDELNIDSEDLTSEEIKEVIIDAHKKKNDDLVRWHTFPGCHDHGIDCDCGKNCTWTVGDHRCSCDNYKGFEFNTDDVDWENDITLESTYFCGSQERQW